MTYTAAIPVFNNASTLRRVIDAMRAQTIPATELIVVDDGSTDASAQIARDAGARVISFTQNTGRGAARAKIMEEATEPLVLMCDATIVLDSNFVEKAMVWLENNPVAAVCAYVSQSASNNVIERWRGRHLYRINSERVLKFGAPLTTGAAILRKSATISVGNFAAHLRHTEDGDLGERLLAAQWDVITDPTLPVHCIGENTLFQLMERYWRWNAGKDERTNWKAYLKQIAFSIRTMAAKDLAAGDPASVPISLLSPHYQFWKSWLRKRS